MKIYIVTDLEGVCGVVHTDQTTVLGNAYEKAREWLTAEVNSAVQGAIEGGAKEILILDGHGLNNACNLIYEKLHQGARYIQGTPWIEDLQSLDSSFDGLIQLGAHAMAGTRGAVLEHTMSSSNWYEMRVNGKPMGEIGLIALLGGNHGVPFIMVSGDDKACSEAVELCPIIERAIVKKGISRHCANMLSSQAACALISDKAKAAVLKASSINALTIDSPVEIEVDYTRTILVDSIREHDGVKRISGRTVRYTGQSIIDAYNRLRGG